MLRVLIVEDNRIFREAFRKGLVDYFPSMVIQEAGNADEALERIKGGPPDLIFMDIRLPGINGLQLTKRIKRDLPDVNIAILTDYDLPEYRQAAVQYGADRFFVKNSLKWDDLEVLVRSISPGGS